MDVAAPAIVHSVDAHLGDCDGVEATRRAFHHVRDEIDYPTLSIEPHPVIVATLMASDDALVMYGRGLPERLAPLGL